MLARLAHGLLVFGVSVGASPREAPTGSTGSSYVITLRADSMRLVHVDAKLPLTDTLLSMVPWGAEHLPDGWRTFIKNERARDAEGHEVSLRRIAGRQWVVAAPVGSVIGLSYDLEIRHGESNWQPDVREAAFTLADRISIVGRALFILPSFDLTDTHITLRLPAGWKLSVPWDSVPGQSGEFVAATRRDLVESVLFAGEFNEFVVREGGLTVRFAIGHEIDNLRDVYINATRKMLAEHLGTFGGPPIWQTMQVLVNPDPLNRGGGGGVFRKSISMTFTTPPSAANITEWGHTFSHEFFHIWNASTLVGASTAEEWLKEGGGDYYGVLALPRAGLISTDAYLAKLSTGYRRYMAVAGKASLTDAGPRKAERLAQELLYNGGWCVLMALDIDLRTHSDGRLTLDDVMRDLYRKITTREVPSISNAAVLASLLKVSGTDYTSFFQQYVAGTAVLPFGEYVARMGLEITPGGNIQVRSTASVAERQLLATFFQSSAKR